MIHLPLLNHAILPSTTLAMVLHNAALPITTLPWYQIMPHKMYYHLQWYKTMSHSWADQMYWHWAMLSQQVFQLRYVKPCLFIRNFPCYGIEPYRIAKPLVALEVFWIPIQFLSHSICIIIFQKFNFPYIPGSCTLAISQFSQSCFHTIFCRHDYHVWCMRDTWQSYYTLSIVLC